MPIALAGSIGTSALPKSGEAVGWMPARGQCRDRRRVLENCSMVAGDAIQPEPHRAATLVRDHLFTVMGRTSVRPGPTTMQEDPVTVRREC